VQFDLNALFANASTVARVPLFLLAINLARGFPPLVYVPLLGRAKSPMTRDRRRRTAPELDCQSARSGNKHLVVGVTLVAR
jgi:hypothetical protein